MAGLRALLQTAGLEHKLTAAEAWFDAQGSDSIMELRDVGGTEEEELITHLQLKPGKQKLLRKHLSEVKEMDALMVA